MDKEQLIQVIVAEVMQRIKRLNHSQQDLRKTILLYNNGNSSITQWLSTQLTATHNIVTIEELKFLQEDYDCIVLNEVSCQELAHIALGLYESSKEYEIVQALFNGKKIYLIDEGIEYKKYSKCANKLLFKLYQEYESKLVSYGIRILNKETLLQELQSQLFQDFNEKRENVINITDAIDLSEKRLITESEIRQIYKMNIKAIKVSKNTMITPMAKDFIRINHIEIIHIEMDTTSRTKGRMTT